MDALNRNTLMVIINFMRRFIEYEENNKMGLKNISMMFAPNIFRDANGN